MVSKQSMSNFAAPCQARFNERYSDRDMNKITRTNCLELKIAMFLVMQKKCICKAL